MEDERDDDVTAPAEPAGKKKRDLRGDRDESEMRRQRYIDAVIDAKIAEAAGGPKVNYSQCARDAGYPDSTAKAMSHWLRHKPDVQGEIRMRLTAAGISDAEIIGFPASVIRYSLADMIDIFPDGHWEPNLNKAVANGSIHAIRELSYDAKGRPKIKTYDKLKASDQLASIRGLKRADVKPSDLELARLVIEDDIRLFRERILLQTGGDERAADAAAEQYRRDLCSRPEYAPYMDVDRTRDEDSVQ